MIELFLVKKTNVYNYSVSSSGATNIGGLIRTDDNKGFSLDLFENEKIPITYQISDINDPSLKKASFSKNFLIPGTKRNSIALDFPYMVSTDVAFSVYNGSVVETGVTGLFEWHLPVQEAQLYVDGILAFSGQLELSRAIINNGEVNSFEVNFLATQINIFDELENKNMRDLDMPSPQIASTGDVYKIFNVASSDDTFVLAGETYNGWTLAYPDWGFSAVGPTGTYDDRVAALATTGQTKIFTNSNTPPIHINNCGLWVGYNFTQYAFVKFLVDQIFDGIDFSYDSTFFETDEFKKLILLCYDSSEPPSNTMLRIFGSHPSAGSYFDDQFTGVACPGTSDNFCGNWNSTGRVPAGSPFGPGTDLRDPFDLLDEASGVLKFNSTGVYNIRMQAVVDIRFGWDMLYLGTQGANCPGGTPNANVYPWATAPLLGPNSRLYWYNETTGVSVTEDISGAAMVTTALATPNTYVKGGVTHYQWESSHDLYTVPLNFTINAQAGDVWKLYLRTDPNSYCNQATAVGCNALPIAQRKYQAALDVLAVDVSPMYPNWKQTLPDITQKAFLSAIIKHFNIYSEIAPNSRVITMEPRDTFFNFGNVQDWTNKMDLATAREIVRSNPPVEVIARMKKTQNRDDKNNQDTTAESLEYGSYQVFLSNGKDTVQQFSSDFASLTPDFMKHLQTTGSSTKLIQTRATYLGTEWVWNIPNPALFPQNANGERELVAESDMYLAYRPNLVRPESDTSSVTLQYANYFLPGATGFIGNLLNNMGSPRCDHLWSLSAIGGTGTDVNFAATRTTWLSGGDIPPIFSYLYTNYDQYFENFYLNLNEQKILRAQFRLEPADIVRFSFRNPVWITFPNGDGDYFIVSTIQYDPTSENNSTVELITFNKEYFNFDYRSISPFAPGPDYPAPAATGPAPALPPDQGGGGEYPIKGEA